jgi:hypothetical protein
MDVLLQKKKTNFHSKFQKVLERKFHPKRKIFLIEMEIFSLSKLIEER